MAVVVRAPACRILLREGGGKGQVRSKAQSLWVAVPVLVGIVSRLLRSEQQRLTLQWLVSSFSQCNPGTREQTCTPDLMMWSVTATAA